MKTVTKLKTNKKLPKSAMDVLVYLMKNGKTSRNQINKDLDLSVKHITYGLRLLRQNGIITRQPNLNDMRCTYYIIDPVKYDETKELLEDPVIAINYLNSIYTN